MLLLFLVVVVVVLVLAAAAAAVGFDIAEGYSLFLLFYFSGFSTRLMRPASPPISMVTADGAASPPRPAPDFPFGAVVAAIFQGMRRDPPKTIKPILCIGFWLR